MATRNLLHKNQLNAFRDFLNRKGYVQVAHSPAHTGQHVPFEELKMMRPGFTGPRRTVIVYSRARAPEHLTVQEKDRHLVFEFLKEKKEAKE